MEDWHDLDYFFKRSLVSWQIEWILHQTNRKWYCQVRDQVTDDRKKEHPSIDKMEYFSRATFTKIFVLTAKQLNK